MTPLQKGVFPLSDEGVEAAAKALYAATYGKYKAGTPTGEQHDSICRDTASLAITAFLQAEGFEVEGWLNIENEPAAFKHQRLVGPWKPL